MQQLTEFISFIKERELIRIKRSRGMPWPWTTDEILSTFRFCNVNRQHDRETIGLQAWLGGLRGSAQDMIFCATAMRLFNQTHTMRAIGYMSVATRWEDQIRAGVTKIRLMNLTPFNPAYIVSTNGVAMDKVEYLIERVLGPMAKKLRSRALPAPLSCNGLAVYLMEIDGIGDFICNQIITDLKYGILSETEDWQRFVKAGPGTKRGLNRLAGRPAKSPLSESQAYSELIAVRKAVGGMNISPVPQHFFHDLNNLSNCFCEFDKYLRAKTGEGRPKQKYTYAEEV